MKTKLIKQAITARDWHTTEAILSSLSSSELKRTEKELRTSFLPTVEPALFWEASLHLIIYKKQAFLTCLAAIGSHSEHGSIATDSMEAEALAQYFCNIIPDYVNKALNIMLPLVHNLDDMKALIELFRIENPMQRLTVLLQLDSPESYYLLFSTLQQMNDNQDLARRCCLFIMKRRTDMANNMASLIASYFGIEDRLPHFSLNISAYELAHISTSFDNFLHILQGKRPNFK